MMQEQGIKDSFHRSNEITPLLLANFWKEKCADKQLVEEAEKYKSNLLQALPQKNGAPLIAIQTMGSPGAGKSTFVDLIHSRLNEQGIDFYKHNSDSIMEQLPPYQEDLTKIGAEKAFARWELPARSLGYTILSNVVEKQIPFIFDSCGVDERQVSLLQHLQKQGYKTSVVHLDVTIETALQRVRDRHVDDKSRFTPKHLITSRHPLLPNLLEKYSQVTNVISVDNNQFPNEAILSFVVGNIMLTTKPDQECHSKIRFNDLEQ